MPLLAPLMLNQTHTFATLEVSKATYDEIAAKLKAAGYDHAFVKATGKDGEVIDMHGIGLVAGPAVAPLLRLTGPNSDGEYWLHVNPKTGPKGGIVMPRLDRRSICLKSITNAIAEQNSA